MSKKLQLLIIKSLNSIVMKHSYLFFILFFSAQAMNNVKIPMDLGRGLNQDLQSFESGETPQLPLSLQLEPSSFFQSNEQQPEFLLVQNNPHDSLEKLPQIMPINNSLYTACIHKGCAKKFDTLERMITHLASQHHTHEIICFYCTNRFSTELSFKTTQSYILHLELQHKKECPAVLRDKIALELGQLFSFKARLNSIGIHAIKSNYKQEFLMLLEFYLKSTK